MFSRCPGSIPEAAAWLVKVEAGRPDSRAFPSGRVTFQAPTPPGDQGLQQLNPGEFREQREF